jgi:hypothetical protein
MVTETQERIVAVAKLAEKDEGEEELEDDTVEAELLVGDTEE